MDVNVIYIISYLWLSLLLVAISFNDTTQPQQINSTYSNLNVFPVSHGHQFERNFLWIPFDDRNESFLYSAFVFGDSWTESTSKLYIFRNMFFVSCWLSCVFSTHIEGTFMFTSCVGRWDHLHLRWLWAFVRVCVRMYLFVTSHSLLTVYSFIIRWYPYPLFVLLNKYIRWYIFRVIFHFICGFTVIRISPNPY